MKSPFNNIRPYKPLRPGEPVPEPLPPAPLLSPKVLLAIGVLVLAQLWGLLGSRPKTSVPDPEWENFPFVGSQPPAGNTTPGVIRYGPETGTQVDYAGEECESRSIAIAGYLYYSISAVAIEGIETTAGECGGFRTIAPRFRLADGSVVIGSQCFTEYHGIKSIPGIRTEWEGPDPAPWLPPLRPIPLPPDYQPSPAPELEPLEEPERVVPALPPAPVIPAVPGEPVPPERTEPLPVLPGTPFVPLRVLPSTPQVPQPVVPSTPKVPGSAPIQDGAVVQAKPKPTPTTPSDVVFPVPGGGPVGGKSQAPQATLKGIAQETGRIEKKLEALMNPTSNNLGDKWDLLMRLVEAFFALNAGGAYSLTEPCDTDGDGQLVTREVTYPGALNAFGVISNKLDALAALQQVAKDFRQPICRHPKASGDLVTVNFVSDAPSPQGSRPLRKYLRYRDQINNDLLVHGAHWRDFSWQAGPVCVCHKNGPWGVLQVWAVTADEGKRVIRHAGAVAGVNPDKDGDWIITGSSDPRYGQPGTMRVERRIAGELRQEFLRVTKRSDPNGMPLLPAA